MGVKQFVMTQNYYSKTVNRSKNLLKDIEAGMRKRSSANKARIEQIPRCRECRVPLLVGSNVVSKHTVSGGRSIAATKLYCPPCAKLKNII